MLDKNLLKKKVFAHIICWSSEIIHFVCVLQMSVCKSARADLVFLVDGSWSIGDDNFHKVTRFLYNTAGAMADIGPEGTQV